MLLPAFVFLTLCMVASLTAETIGNVEYQLPEEGQKWKTEKTGPSEGIPGKTILYQPENQSPFGIEFFGAYIKKSPINIKNSESLKQEIERTYPGQKVLFQVLSADAQSELVEWAVSKDNHEKLHGWARIFSTPDNTVMLFYQTEKVTDVDKVRETWLKTLKEAKVSVPPASPLPAS